MLKEEEISRKKPSKSIACFLFSQVCIHTPTEWQSKIQVVEGGRERQARTRIGYFCKSGDGRGDVAMGTMLLAGGFYSNRTGVV